MDRRNFLKLAGATSTVALTGVPASKAAAKSKSKGPAIIRERVVARNDNRSTVVAQHGMVCASQPLATMAGIDILKAGGNCVDAAIATNAMLGLMEPASNGIGGDLFAIVWIEKDQRLYGLNASGRAPYDWNLEDALGMGFDYIPRKTPLAWSVPGCVSGWEALSKRFGKMSLAKCLEPTVHYARDGFPLSPIIAGHFNFRPKSMPDVAKLFKIKGTPPRYGDIIKNPDLGRSLEQIGASGAAAFYEGEIAERIVAKSEAGGGRMSMRDLKDHTATWTDPVSSNYRGYDVWELPPSGQGIAALQMLNMLEHFDIGDLKPNSAEHLHLLIEAKKLAFEDRATHYADPEFAAVPTEWLISKEYGKQRAALINPRKASTKIGHGDPTMDTDTVFLTASDSDGNMISFIQSVYNSFGSTLVPDGVGFAIQNRGQLFALDPKHNNKLEPHKRPFHTIIPAFMTRKGRPVWAFGVMGGDFQPQGHAQVVMNVVDYGMSAQQAGEQPRVAHFGSSTPTGVKMRNGGSVGFEHRIDDTAKLKLAQMGHNISAYIEAHGGYQSIWREDDPLVYFGGSDPRKDGAAMGY